MDFFFIKNCKDQKLYCIYHQPSISINNNTGVVLCYPIGHEYIRSHRLYVFIAELFADMGFHTMRFDYIGTGDSQEDFSAFSIDQSLNDLKLVIGQLKENTGISKIYLFAVRLGATLAILYAMLEAIDKLILISPAYKGKDYLQDINNKYLTWLNGSFAKINRKENSNYNYNELFGYNYTKKIITEIENIDIRQDIAKIQVDTLLIDEDIHIINTKINYRKKISKEFWLNKEGDREQSIIPMDEIYMIKNWI